MHTVLVLTGSTHARRGRAVPVPAVADRRLDRRPDRRARRRDLIAVSKPPGRHLPWRCERSSRELPLHYGHHGIGGQGRAGARGRTFRAFFDGRGGWASTCTRRPGRAWSATRSRAASSIPCAAISGSSASGVRRTACSAPSCRCSRRARLCTARAPVRSGRRAAGAGLTDHRSRVDQGTRTSRSRCSRTENGRPRSCPGGRRHLRFAGVGRPDTRSLTRWRPSVFPLLVLAQHDMCRSSCGTSFGTPRHVSSTSTHPVATSRVA